ncbi:VOC family protein [Kitasatospora sp. RB6PN24]|uniref:VOC family protein n=1 Tax=Kitasatospora humi TaxID=2893891 RepID=UPI001E607032|nr:VOC family protein [Kitasatospora humi]MCC9310605.1 VOC family protein [Kitasatospora humi]
MTTNGISALFVKTHNWGKAARFFQNLGYQLEFETGHNSGQFRNGESPAVFIAEVPEDQATGSQLVLQVVSEQQVHANPDLELLSPFEDTHYGTREATVRDPDGHLWLLQAPAAE